MPCIDNVEHYNAKEPTGAEPCCPADVTREDMNESSYKDNLNVTLPHSKCAKLGQKFGALQRIIL